MRPHGDINLVDYHDDGFEALIHQADAATIIPIDTLEKHVLVSPHVYGWRDNQFAFHPSKFLSVDP